jgi:hypothetical protein
MIRSRMKSGLERAKARGVRLCRPRTGAKIEAAIRARLAAGEGIRKVAKAVGVGNGTVSRIKSAMAGRPASDSKEPRPALFPNGSRRGRPPPQILQPNQHREHSLQLPVEVHLVAAEPLQLVGVERLAERLLANQRQDCQLLLTSAQPRQPWTSKKRRSPSASAVAGAPPSSRSAGSRASASAHQSRALSDNAASAGSYGSLRREPSRLSARRVKSASCVVSSADQAQPPPAAILRSSVRIPAPRRLRRWQETADGTRPRRKTRRRARTPPGSPQLGLR